MLAEMVGNGEQTWNLRFEIAFGLLKKGERKKAEKVISDIDAKQCVLQSKNPATITLIMNTLILIDDVETVFSLLKSPHVVLHCYGSNHIDLSIKTLNAMKRLGMNKKFQKLLQTIDVKKAYHQCNELQNAYAQVAWMRYIPEDLAFEKTIPYFKLDQQQGRLSSAWQINYAQALMISEKIADAEFQIEAAYQKKTEIKNGYASCGRWRYFNLYYEPEMALEWFLKDFDLGRLDNIFLIHYAVLFAAVGDIRSAIDIVEKAYDNYPQIKNGYALIGWYYYMIRERNPEKALSFLKIDQKRNRLTTDFGYYAGIYSYLGDRGKAEEIVKQAYRYSKNIGGWYLIVGICDYALRNDVEYLKKMVKKDMHLERQKISFMHFLSWAVSLDGRNTTGYDGMLKEFCERTPKVYDFTLSWVKKISIDWKNFQEAFMRL